MYLPSITIYFHLFFYINNSNTCHQPLCWIFYVVTLHTVYLDACSIEYENVREKSNFVMILSSRQFIRSDSRLEKKDRKVVLFYIHNRALSHDSKKMRESKSRKRAFSHTLTQRLLTSFFLYKWRCRMLGSRKRKKIFSSWESQSWFSMYNGKFGWIWTETNSHIKLTHKKAKNENEEKNR